MKTFDKIRYFSDLHIDVNKNFPIELPESDLFTVVAGDVSGNVDKSIAWIKKNVKRGIVVAGNHIVYDTKNVKKFETLKNKLAEAFPPDGDIVFLDCSTGTCSIVKSGVLFIGTTLYTDYKYECGMLLPCSCVEEVYNRNLSIARHGLNDFGRKVRVTPEMYAEWFNRDLAEISRILEENENSGNPLPVVVVTHHCPSTKFIVEKFKESDLNASFVSDLDWFINEHPSVKAWIAGHIHSKITAETESGCKLLANPRGYYSDYWFDDFKARQADYKNFKPGIVKWNPNMLLDLGDWSVREQT